MHTHTSGKRFADNIASLLRVRLSSPEVNKKDVEHY